MLKKICKFILSGIALLLAFFLFKSKQAPRSKGLNMKNIEVALRKMDRPTAIKRFKKDFGGRNGK